MPCFLRGVSLQGNFDAQNFDKFSFDKIQDLQSAYTKCIFIKLLVVRIN